ncbi:tail fiber assembly protein [Enterobacter bugandensis]|uniref:tail fiber assembly protein n=1 Tax=Enterobacter bugandensis TaxID=881260 RepID=UPI0021CF7F08|nr:tail fiber assembly protein [Enterobacter bugandensis]MCU6214433.1 tail fiber assembly protein [Enterobacter bugandensis]
MLSLLNFMLCKADKDDVAKFGDYADGIQFLKSEDGIKWYDAQKEFSSTTLKIAYIASGLVAAINSDVSKLFPINMSVIEVDSLPENCTAENITNGSWKVDGGQVVYSPRTEEVISE